MKSMCKPCPRNVKYRGGIVGWRPEDTIQEVCEFKLRGPIIFSSMELESTSINCLNHSEPPFEKGHKTTLFIILL